MHVYICIMITPGTTLFNVAQRAYAAAAHGIEHRDPTSIKLASASPSIPAVISGACSVQALLR